MMLSADKRIFWGALSKLGFFCCGMWIVSSSAWANTLEDISFSALPGDKFEVRMQFSDTPPEPEGYTIEEPARIFIDFPNVDNALKTRSFPLSIGNAQSANVVSADNRTRLILNLLEATSYTYRTENNTLIFEVGNEAGGASAVAQGATTAASASRSVLAAGSENSITYIDFRRGEAGEGKVIIDLSTPNIGVDMRESRGAIEITFEGAEIPSELRRRYDVTDFATPVNFVDADNQRVGGVIRVEASGNYDYLAYQTDNEYVLSVKPLTQREVEEKQSQFEFTGEKISLDFQDIEVRSVLSLIADIADLNLVTSDTVSGNITLRLTNVPWDQALDLVLDTKGLDKRQVGNVLRVAPAAEIAEQERQEIETQRQLEELAPLRTEYIRIRYANAQDIYNLFSTRGSTGGSSGGQGGNQGAQGFLSERGSARVDQRTNSIILTETADKITQIRELIDQIDIPIRQVMIEARIVIANTDFRKEIGVRWAGDAQRLPKSGSTKFEATGRLEGLVSADGAGPEAVFIDSDGDGISDDDRNLVDSSLVDLGVTNPAGAITANIISNNILLGLELSALEDSGQAEIVSQPKVVTGDKKQATIESGTQIPYQEASASGATSTSFKDAVLKLDVTPQITPDNNIILDLTINQDSVGDIDVASGIPVIDVTQLETQVLVADGETVVLGGIFKTESQDGVTKVPFLGDIPYLGRLFKQDVKRQEKRELLIFITPRILAETLVQ